MDIDETLNVEELRGRFLEHSRQAFRLLPPIEQPRILDIGCGETATSSSTPRTGKNWFTFSRKISIKCLRIFFRYDRKLVGKLAGCAWRALKLYFDAYFDGAGVNPGAVGFVQTAGELLNFHPHVHVLVTDGGFLPDGTLRPLAWFDSGNVRARRRIRLSLVAVSSHTQEPGAPARVAGFRRLSVDLEISPQLSNRI